MSLTDSLVHFGEFRNVAAHECDANSPICNTEHAHSAFLGGDDTERLVPPARRHTVMPAATAGVAHKQACEAASLRAQTERFGASQAYVMNSQMKLLLQALLNFASFVAPVLPHNCELRKMAQLFPLGCERSAAEQGCNYLVQRADNILSEIDMCSASLQVQRHRLLAALQRKPFAAALRTQLSALDTYIFWLATMRRNLVEFVALRSDFADFQEKQREMARAHETLGADLFQANARQAIDSFVVPARTDVTTCVICQYDFDVERAPVRWRCCKNIVCRHCVTHHAILSSQFGSRTSVRCMLCRHEFPLYNHLGAQQSIER